MSHFAYKSLINFARSHQKHINFYFALSHGAFICLCEHSHYFYDKESGLCEKREKKIIEKEKEILKQFKNDKKKFIYLKSCLK